MEINVKFFVFAVQMCSVFAGLLSSCKKSVLFSKPPVGYNDGNRGAQTGAVGDWVGGRSNREGWVVEAQRALPFEPPLITIFSRVRSLYLIQKSASLFSMKATGKRILFVIS